MRCDVCLKREAGYTVAGSVCAWVVVACWGCLVATVVRGSTRCFGSDVASRGGHRMPTKTCRLSIPICLSMHACIVRAHRKSVAGRERGGASESLDIWWCHLPRCTRACVRFFQLRERFCVRGSKESRERVSYNPTARRVLEQPSGNTIFVAAPIRFSCSSSSSLSALDTGKKEVEV